ncbi:MAG: RHS repeat protein [Lachnospiraceae bacterium]|nr:RHS repeat protein [Lachnospiraceae bacterium]
MYEYDKLGRITSLTDELGTIEYIYDGNGNVLTVSETDKA